MLHHLLFAVSDLLRSSGFYDSVLSELGYVQVWADQRAVGYGTDGGGDKFAVKLRSQGVVIPEEGFHVTFGAPTRTAAALTVGWDLIVFGGESMAQTSAHQEVQALDTRTGQWRSLPSLLQGRHGTGVVLSDGAFYTCAGAGERGGKPLLPTMERFDLRSGK
jgi:hypothetical protein